MTWLRRLARNIACLTGRHRYGFNFKWEQPVVCYCKWCGKQWT